MEQYLSTSQQEDWELIHEKDGHKSFGDAIIAE